MACWAHARRKIYDVYEATAAPLAKEALDRIAELFAIEARINGRLPSERLAVRQQDAVPLLAELEAFYHQAQSQISGKSTLAKAIRYSLFVAAFASAVGAIIWWHASSFISEDIRRASDRRRAQMVSAFMVERRAGPRRKTEIRNQ